MTEDIKRTYTIPLRRGYCNTPRYKRTNKAVRVLKAFLVRHMKSEDIKLGKNLNEFIWAKGIRNPPSKVRVDVVKDKEGVVKVELVGKEYKDFKVQEKTERNQSLKEKLKSKVSSATDGATEKVEKKPKAETKTEKPVAPKKESAKTATKETEKPKVQEAPKVQKTPAKEAAKPKVQEAPKATTEPEVKAESAEKKAE